MRVSRPGSGLRPRRLLVALALLVAAPASASAPERSLLPHWRPGAVETVTAAAARPGEVLAVPVRAAAVAAAISAQAVAVSPRPLARPGRLAERFATKAAALRIAPQPGGGKARKGSVCGLPGVQGVALSRIASAVQGCGVEAPVKVASVAGVALSTPATMDCATARALSAWVSGAVLPVVGNSGGGVARLQVAADYTCRPRNNVKGAKVSEHGRGKAIDISAIVLKNGTVLSVLKGWRDKNQGPILKALHRAACGPFGTVLGPSANAMHQDHFHLDTASYRKGHYCR
jgi:hypothetical protein